MTGGAADEAGQRCAKRKDMVLRHAKYLTALALAAFVSSYEASEHKGQVRVGEVPIPGAVVLAKQGDKVFRAVTDSSGSYAFPDLADGSWTVRVEMAGFETEQLEVAASTEADIVQWNLKMLPMSEMTETATPGFSTSSVSAPTLQTVPPVAEAQDGLLINGSLSNGASTPFALAAGFGNNRRPGRSLYTGTVSFNGNNSVLDARSFSLTGQNTPRPGYNRLQSTITVGGPFQIPSLFRNGSFSVIYSRIQNRNASLQTLQMPTAAERSGDFSASSRAIVDPLTGTAFAGNEIPEDRISPQAKALIDLYPLPNFDGGRYNYQLPIVGVTHGDNLSGQISNFTINNANRLSVAFGIQSTRSDNPDVFGFTDTVNSPGTNASVTWIHRFSQRVSGNIRYQFARTVTQTLPYFGTRLDVSGIAGILGNDRDSRNWGPPASEFFRRYRSPVHRLLCLRSQPGAHHRIHEHLRCWPSCSGLWRRLQETAIQSALTEGSTRHLHVHRRCNRQRFCRFPPGNPDCQFDRIRQCRQVFPSEFLQRVRHGRLQGEGVTDIDYRSAI